MRKLYDTIEWKTKYGKEHGVIVGIKTRVDYIVKIESSGMHVVISEDRLDQISGPDKDRRIK